MEKKQVLITKKESIPKLNKQLVWNKYIGEKTDEGCVNAVM